jgi:dipeptidyl aminopeptidase/acylaminoacyl peptidase
MLRSILFLSAATTFINAEEPIKPSGNLVAEGIPAIPAKVAVEARRYTEARSAGFAAWHSKRMEMLVATRFGATAQLHQVAAPLGMRRQLTFFDEPVTSATYEPTKGEYFVFSRDSGGNEFGQLYRYDVADGRVTLLTDGGRSQNAAGDWSPDGKWLVYMSTRRNGSDRDAYVVDPRKPKETDRLVAQLPGGGWSAGGWSPDAATLLLEEYVSVNESHLWLLNVASGEKRELTPQAEKGVSYGGAEFAADGKSVFLTTDRGAEYKRLLRRNLADGKESVVVEGFAGDVNAFALSKDGRRMVFTVSESGVERAFLLDVASGKYAPIAGVSAAQIGLGGWRDDHRYFAFEMGGARSAGDVHTLDADTGAVTRWTESELGGVVAETLSEPELVKWKSFDGLEISGFLYKPDAQRFPGPRPVIINIHGGPEGQSTPTFLGRGNYFLNELGVAFLFPNVRGSVGFGKTFATLDNGQKREDSVRDIGALLDWLSSQPGLDTKRVMVTGGSYGGYMALACATHFSQRLRCAVDVVGISNFISFLENTESYRRDLRRVEYGDERDPAMRATFERISPLNNASKITIPMFIVQGANDPRVPRGEATQMVAKIRANGGPVWYLEAKDEGHGFKKKPNADYQFYATVAFVREHLLK